MKPFYWIIKSSSNVLLKLFYRHKTYGVEHIIPGAVIIAPNHVSYLDPNVVSASFPEEIIFLAREELFINPFFAFLIRSLNAYPVALEGTRNLTSFKIILNFLKDNKKVVIFPEGNRSEDGELQPLKTGVALIAQRAHCPIIPVYIYGTFQAWPRFNLFPHPGYRTACIIGSPIDPGQFKDMDKKQALNKITAQLAASLEGLKAWYEAGAVGTPP